jgi:hypothetical protein
MYKTAIKYIKYGSASNQPFVPAEIQKQEGHRNGGKEKIYMVIFLLACQMV